MNVLSTLKAIAIRNSFQQHLQQHNQNQKRHLLRFFSASTKEEVHARMAAAAITTSQRAAKRVDSDDLAALDVPFSDDSQLLISSTPIALSNPSISKQDKGIANNNKEFIQDFEDFDFNDEDPTDFIQSNHGTENQHTQTSSQKRKLSPLKRIEYKTPKRLVINDIDLDSSFGDESQCVADITRISDIPETSTPDWVKRETLYPKIIAQQHSSSLNAFDPLKSSFEVSSVTKPALKYETDKAAQTNQLSTINSSIYPLNQINSYEQRYKTPVQAHENLIKNALKRHKESNSRISLLTQRPSVLNEIPLNVRNASTYDKPVQSDSTYIALGKRVTPFSLSEEQEHVLKLAKQGNSIFYTGSAGTGKSVLLRSMIKELKKMYPDCVAVTASTGLAACNIGGITLHSFAGIALGNGSGEELVKRVRRSRKHVRRWKSTKVLVIDEISMIDGALFDKLDYIASTIRRNSKPFGGIQLIICGDFFQLPPVSKSEEEPSVFCFESEAWKRCIDLTITLQKVFRQKGDMDFITMLNEMRLGKLSDQSIKQFKELERSLPQDEIEPAELYCTRYEVDRANKQRLNKLETPIRVYNSWDGGILEDPEQRQRLLANFMAPKRLELRVGAQVMLIKNLDETLVNGSLGKVIDFICQDTYLTFQKLEENPNLSDSEIANAIHEAENKAEDDQKVIMEEPSDQDISPDLEGTVFDFFNTIDSEDPEIKKNIEKKKKLMNDLHQSSKGRRLPLVKFLTPDGQSRTILVQPETWEIEDEHEKPLVSRMQVPLILAWALSIHKSQGQTLPRVRVDLRRVFEKGQTYVALSRAVSRKGLQILNFDANKVWAHEKVRAFYSHLQNVEEANQMLTDRELLDLKSYSEKPLNQQTGIQRPRSKGKRIPEESDQGPSLNQDPVHFS